MHICTLYIVFLRVEEVALEILDSLETVRAQGTFELRALAAFVAQMPPQRAQHLVILSTIGAHKTAVLWRVRVRTWNYYVNVRTSNIGNFRLPVFSVGPKSQMQIHAYTCKTFHIKFFFVTDASFSWPGLVAAGILFPWVPTKVLQQFWKVSTTGNSLHYLFFSF